VLVEFASLQRRQRAALLLTPFFSELSIHRIPPPQDRYRLTSRLLKSIHILPSSLLFPSATRVHESGEERGVFGLSSIDPLPMSHSSTSTLSDSVVTTPVFAAFSTPNLGIVPSGHQVILVKSTTGSAPPPDLPHHPTIQIHLTKSSQPTNTLRMCLHRSTWPQSDGDNFFPRIEYSLVGFVSKMQKQGSAEEFCDPERGEIDLLLAYVLISYRDS
jgi:hypothetical protein